MAGRPNPMAILESPVTLDKNLRFAGRIALDFHARCGRLLSDDNCARGLGGNHRFSGYDRGLMMRNTAAQEQAGYQWQNA